MNVDVKIFGYLAEIIGEESLSFQGIPDTERLINHLIERYPAMGNARFACAVNLKIITANTPLSDNCEVAILPPFSGG
jgi:molybdopterin converting factor small subunit